MAVPKKRTSRTKTKTRKAQWLRKADLMKAKRAQIASIYSKAFANLPFKMPSMDDHMFESSWHLFSIEIEESFSKNRDQVMDELSILGVQTSLHYIPLHHFSFWKSSLDLAMHEFPNAEKRFTSTISLPIFPNMSELEIQYVIESVIKIFA